MLKLLLLFLLPITTFATEFNYKILRVIDGDTVEIAAPFLPPPLPPTLSLRIIGLDTPDIHGHEKCPQENLLGLQAKNFTENFIQRAKQLTVKIKQWDKFGGRLDGDIIGDNTSLHDALLQNKLAQTYDGNKKPNWCIITH